MYVMVLMICDGQLTSVREGEGGREREGGGREGGRGREGEGGRKRGWATLTG